MPWFEVPLPYSENIADFECMLFSKRLNMASSSSDDSVAKLQKDLADLSPEELQALKERIGLKAFRRLFTSPEELSHVKGPKPRENKNRPTEVSSKKRVRPAAPDAGNKKRVVRDPRFDDVSGEFREEIFNRDYAFIADLKARDKQKVQKQLKKEKNQFQKEKLRHLLNKMTQEEQTKEKKKKKEELVQQWKEKEKERVKEGKTPYFLKKSDIHKLELAERFKELKEQGKVKKVLERKRKQNASRQRKKILT